MAQRRLQLEHEYWRFSLKAFRGSGVGAPVRRRGSGLLWFSVLMSRFLGRLAPGGATVARWWRMACWLEGVEEAEEDAEPGVPGQDAPADLAGAFYTWQGISMKAWKKVRKSIVSRRRRCSLCWAAQRG